MTLRKYLVGVAVVLLVLFVCYVGSPYNSPVKFYFVAIAAAYIGFSTLALLITNLGRTKSQKAWVYYLSGSILLTAFIPMERWVVDLYYGTWAHFDHYGELHYAAIPFSREVLLLGPLVVFSMSIFRGISIWCEESLLKSESNQSVQTRSTSGPV